ncbi:hypothetical protein GCM10010343_31390 [Streptomyces avidinii]|nr:hypothetical protein GCM10010343_31390 [Streptomyces avidinii]
MIMNSSQTVRPPPAPVEPGSDFARLSMKIQAAGLMSRRPGYYTLRITAVTVLYVAGWTAFAMIGDSWWTLLSAGCLALAFGQVALLAHDVAHRQVFRLRKPSELSGHIAGNLGIGMGYGSRHPRVGPGPGPVATGLPRLLDRHRAWEGVLLFTHLAASLGALFLVLSPVRAIAVLVVSINASSASAPARTCPEPQRHAGAARHRPPGLPAPSGADFPRRKGRPFHRRGVRRPEPPDRAPPLPEHAEPDLRRARTSSTATAGSWVSATWRPA